MKTDYTSYVFWDGERYNHIADETMIGNALSLLKKRSKKYWSIRNQARFSILLDSLITILREEEELIFID